MLDQRFKRRHLSLEAFWRGFQTTSDIVLIKYDVTFMTLRVTARPCRWLSMHDSAKRNLLMTMRLSKSFCRFFCVSALRPSSEILFFCNSFLPFRVSCLFSSSSNQIKCLSALKANRLIAVNRLLFYNCLLRLPLLLLRLLSSPRIEEQWEEKEGEEEKEAACSRRKEGVIIITRRTFEDGLSVKT